MKKIILLFLLSLWAGSSWGETITIGTGTSTSYFPLTDYYVYSRSQSLFLASEINYIGTITNLRWYRDSFGPDFNAIGITEIWLKETSAIQLIGNVWEDPGILVATITNLSLGLGPGWLDIPITNFSYSGSNLLVSIRTQNAPFVSPHATWRYTSTLTPNKYRIGYSNTTNPPSMQLSINRPNIQVEITAPIRLLSVSPEQLDFGYTPGGSVSVETTYTISGTNLNGSPVMVNAPPYFEVSLTSGGGFGPSLVITYSGPTLPATLIFVRFVPPWDNADFSGNITNEGGGAAPKLVAVTGNSWQHNKWCTSSATSAVDTEVLNVTVGTINNTSDCVTPAPGPGSILKRYSNFFYDVPPTELPQGSSAEFTVQVGTCGSNYNNAMKIYIDFNQDGDFDDPGEEGYVSSSYTNGPHTESGAIAIPSDATIGSTMMRVVCVETVDPSSIESCSAYTYGETEDYKVNIIEGIPQTYYSVHEAYLDPTIQPGQTIWVGGYYTNPDENMLLEYYGDILKNEALPPQSVIKLSGGLPPTAGWNGGYIVVYGVVSFIDNPQYYHPEDATLIGIDVINSYVIFSGAELPSKSGQIEYQKDDGGKECDPCKFAILISGGINDENNHARYWESLVALYQHKTVTDNYCLENVIVHYFDGNADDGRIPQARVKKAQKDSISKSFTDISSRVAACSKAGTPATFQKFVFNHGNAAGNINLLGNNVITPVELKNMQQKVIDSCCSTVYDEFLQCYAGYSVDEMSKLDNKNKATIYVNSSADKTESWSPTGSSVDKYLAAKLASLAAGNSYENAVVAAKLAYDNFLQGIVNYDHQQAMAWRAQPASEKRTTQIALWVADSAKVAQAICKSRNVTVTPMKNYCEWKRFVVPPHGQLVLNFEGLLRANGNVTVYQEGAFGIQTKVAEWNWNIPGSARYFQGNERRVINGNLNSTTVFRVHNDDEIFRMTASSLGWQNLMVSPSNPFTHPGFSFGGTDYASTEFGYFATSVFTYQNIDQIPLDLTDLPGYLGPQFVQDFGYTFTIDPEDEYWTNMELYIRVNEVFQPGLFHVFTENSPTGNQMVEITGPGVYQIPLGDMTIAGSGGFIEMMAQNVAFSLDCWGLRSNFDPTALIVFAGNDATACETDPYLLAGSNAMNYSTLEWTTTGDGSFNNPSLLHPVYTPGPMDKETRSAELCLTGWPLPPNTIPATDCMILHIQRLPTVSAGPDASILEEESYPLPATASDFSTVQWSHTGSGYFDDPNLLNPTYFPGADDAGTTVNLCISALPVTPCQLSASDCMDLYVQPAPPVTYWIPFTSAPEGTPPEIEATYGDEFMTDIHVVVHGMWVTEREEGGQVFHELEIPEHATTHDPGIAAMPALRELLGVLPGTQYVEMYTDVISTLEYTGFKVYPYQTPLNEDSTGVFEYDDGFYSSNTTYPSGTGSTSALYSWKELDVADIIMYPIAFNPAQQKLTVTSEMDVHLMHPPGKEASPKGSLVVSGVWISLYSSSLINHNWLLPFFNFDPHLWGKYLIITADNYYNNIMPFADWKTKKGYHVTVKKASTIANPLTSQVVYDTIKAFYSNSTGWDVYVLLVGDVGSNPNSQIPVYTGYPGLFEANIASDYYYSCMGGTSDHYADLFIGRLSVKSTTEVDDMVDVMLDFEESPPSDNWATNALLVAHKQDYPQKYTGCKEEIRKFAYSVTTPVFDTVYGGSGGNNTGVTNAINAGRMVVNYRGHGSTTDWSSWNSSFSPSFTTTNVNNLSNGSYTPMVYSISCWNSQIDNVNNDCIGEVWMKKKKAVSHFGATRSSPTTQNHTLDKFLFKASYDKGIYHQGAINNWARTQMLNQYGTSDTYAVGDARMYLLLGDPEMEVLTATPATLAVTHNDSITTGSQAFSVTVKDSGGNAVANALVSLWKGTEVVKNEYTSASGSASFSIQPVTAGKMYVTVTKHNYTPYQGEVDVSKNADLWIRDCLVDDGTVPSNGNCPIWWQSTDMWIDNDKDGIQDAPVVGAANNLYVRPRNLGPANANNVSVDMYYRDNTTGLDYPTGATVIGTVSGLSIVSGGSTTSSVSWTVPQPPNTGGHYCIGAIVSAAYDPQTSKSPVWDNNVCCVNIGYLYARAGTPGKSEIEPAIADFLMRNPDTQAQTFVLDAEMNLPTGWVASFFDLYGQQFTLPYYVTLAPLEERLIHMMVTPPETAQHNDQALVVVKQYSEQGYPGTLSIVGGISFPVLVDLYKPSAITDLNVTPSGDQMLLQWTPVTLDSHGNPENVACYNIYRGDTYDFIPGAANRVGRVAIDQDEGTEGFQWYDDVTETGKYYYVRVEDEAGFESDNSNLGHYSILQTYWLAFDAMPEGTPPEIEVIYADEGMTDIHLLVHGMWVIEKEEGGQLFQALEVPGYATTHEAGKAAMPALRELLGLLPGTEYVEMSADIVSTLNFSGYKVYPYQTPVNEDGTHSFEYDAQFYSSNTQYPYESGEASGLYSWKDIDVSDIVMYPLSFNPAQQSLTASNEMYIHLEHPQGKGGTPKDFLVVSQTWYSMYGSSVINKDWFLPFLQYSTKLHANYLIITADNYYNNILPLANWKTRKGYNVTVKKGSAIANPLTSKAVYDTIKAFYDNSSTKTVYVLLVGDVGSNPNSQIPIYTGYPGLFNENMISDYYYSCMGGADDKYADIFLGRLSVQSTTEVDDMVNMMLSYEQNAPADNWANKVLLAAHRQDYPKKYTACKDSIKNFPYAIKKPTFDTQYGGAGGTNAGVSNAINGGRIIVNYRGHGGSTDWWQWDAASASYTTANVNNLNNGSYTPFVYSIACWNNQLDYAWGDCIGEYWLKKKKAVSHFGATRPSPTTINHTLDEFLFKATYDKAIYHQGLFITGQKPKCSTNTVLPMFMLWVSHVCIFFSGNLKWRSLQVFRQCWL